MKNTLLLFLTIAGLLLPSSSGWAQGFELHVHGTQKVSADVGGDQKILSVSLNAASFFAAFGLDPKQYALVFSGGDIFLIQRSVSAGLPQKQVFSAGPNIYSGESTKPLSTLYYYPLSSTGDDAGTIFDTFDGRITLLVKRKLVSGVLERTSVMGSVTGATTGTNPPYFFNFTFSGTKVFVQKP